MIRDRCKQGLHRHMSNNTGFMNLPIETAAAFPSQAKHCAIFLGSVDGERPLGFGIFRETCTTTTSDANAILATASGD